jgi:hypothetical protein
MSAPCLSQGERAAALQCQWEKPSHLGVTVGLEDSTASCPSEEEEIRISVTLDQQTPASWQADSNSTCGVLLAGAGTA